MMARFHKKQKGDYGRAKLAAPIKVISSGKFFKTILFRMSEKSILSFIVVLPLNSENKDCDRRSASQGNIQEVSCGIA